MSEVQRTVCRTHIRNQVHHVVPNTQLILCTTNNSHYLLLLKTCATAAANSVGGPAAISPAATQACQLVHNVYCCFMLKHNKLRYKAR